MNHPSTSTARLCLSLSLCVSTAHYVTADTYPRQLDIDAVHYTFQLLINDLNEEIAGKSTARMRFVTSAPREVALDLIKSTGATGMTVSAVTCDGKPAPFTHDANRLRITLTQPATAGGEVTCTTTYRGIPAGGLRIINNIHGERTAFSENWPDNARQWLPMIDHPYDKATGEFIVTAPRALPGGGQRPAGRGDWTCPDGLRRTHWKQSVPIASWLYALGVARFIVRHGGVVQGRAAAELGVPAGRREGLAACSRTTARRAIEFFSESHRPVRLREARARARPPASAAAPSTRARSSTARRA